MLFSLYLVLIFHDTAIESFDHKVFKLLHHFRRLLRKLSRRGELCQNGEALAEFVLQMSCATKTLELTIHHDSESSTKLLTLFHTEMVMFFKVCII